MSPAGSGAIRYIPKPHKRLAWAVLASAGLLSIVLLMSGGSTAHASTRAPVAALNRSQTRCCAVGDSAHKLRQGNASLMARQGLTPSQIASHLGHAHGGVLALKTYVHSDRLHSADFVDVALA